ncbi:uncharacterized protein LOC103707327 isoform X2 [Phoenix dactylifera]|uniref:Uncharacterized protein LOC103707327 isoform X2 n=1 Tax=Phoenix dactylifera TaxID=42345 RepID=A0A8B9AEH8_PHODC|nr:uncharacterized protein LOC103707327 isoform X2 [Phoenix dactylifera]
MDLGHLTPALERLYIDEVLHLHSLWHRGPQRNPNPHPNPTLRPATSAAFKKEAKKKKKSKSKWEKKWERKKQQQQTSAAASDQPPVKVVEWPRNPTPEKYAAMATWTDIAPPPAASQPRPPASAEERARVTADLAQQSGLKTCEDFFSRKDGSDDGEEDEDEEDSMDENEEETEEGDFKFFLRLFNGDRELREYYEKNWEKGDFSCLVCGATGVKKWKRFGNCVGLIQHSNSISKTKRREAHRAFARAVCEVLVWDINRLPSIAFDLGNSLGQSLAKTANPQDMQKEDPSAQEGLSVGVEEPSKEVYENVETDKVDLMDCIEKEIKALPSENLQKEVEIDERENDEDPMD